MHEKRVVITCKQRLHRQRSYGHIALLYINIPLKERFLKINCKIYGLDLVECAAYVVDFIYLVNNRNELSN